jgi:hypothetical protein
MSNPPHVVVEPARAVEPGVSFGCDSMHEVVALCREGVVVSATFEIGTADALVAALRTIQDDFGNLDNIVIETRTYNMYPTDCVPSAAEIRGLDFTERRRLIATKTRAIPVRHALTVMARWVD